MQVVIVGGGGLCREVLQYVLDCAENGQPIGQIRGVLDDGQPDITRFYPDVPFLGPVDAYARASDDEGVLIAVGQTPTRGELAERIRARGGSLIGLVHPTAYIAPTAKIAPGCVIGPFAFIGPFAELGENVFVNIRAAIGHNVSVGPGSVVSPHTVINGGATVEADVFIGTQAVVTPDRTVGRRSKIAAGAVVVRDCPPGSFLAGNPARGRVIFRA